MFIFGLKLTQLTHALSVGSDLSVNMNMNSYSSPGLGLGSQTETEIELVATVIAYHGQKAPHVAPSRLLNGLFYILFFIIIIIIIVVIVLPHLPVLFLRLSRLRIVFIFSL